MFLLANIKKDKKEVTWENLDKIEEEKIRKIVDKLHVVCSANLTFLYIQNLIYVQLENRSYFVPTDKDQKILISEELGDLDKKTYVRFILHRQTKGWFRSPILTGYIIKDSPMLIPMLIKDEEKEIRIGKV